MDTWYEDEAEVARRVGEGSHRDVIGGLWEELGALQLEFLKTQGMSPANTLLDLGCGSGRLAVKAVPFLDAGKYYGIDVSPALLGAARRELEQAGAGAKCSADTFHATADFKPSPLMPPGFDFAIAQSLFTHLPLHRFAQALYALRPHFEDGGRLFATFFTAPHHVRERRHQTGGIVSYADRDPFHFPVQDILCAARDVGWSANWIGDWSHPRDQQICELFVAKSDLAG
jgi:SAM-dependent methyltransferase